MLNKAKLISANIVKVRLEKKQKSSRIAPEVIEKLKAVAHRKSTNKKDIGDKTSMQNWVMERLAQILRTKN